MTSDQSNEKDTPTMVETEIMERPRVETPAMEPSHQSIYDIEIDITEILDRLEAEALLAGE
jgi:hypothetical protein